MDVYYNAEQKVLHVHVWWLLLHGLTTFTAEQI